MVVDPSWPRPLPHGWVLGQVSGVAVDGRDHVWIIQRPATAHGTPAPPVIEFDPSGQVVQAWGGAGAGYDWFGSEHGIYVDPKGFVWVGGNGPADGQVLKFTHEGRFVLQVGRPARGAASNDVSRLGRPADVAVDPVANEVYVADGYANHRVIVFDADTGAYRRHWGAYGGRPVDAARLAYDPRAAPARQFGNPVHCVKLAKDGLVYVCDRQNDRVQVFRKDGSFVAEWLVARGTRGMGSVWDLALWPDAGQTLLFNADGQNEQVRVLRRADGMVLGAFGSEGRAPGQFRWVHNIAVDSRGDVFTTEVDGGMRVQRFVPDGDHARTIGQNDARKGVAPWVKQKCAHNEDFAVGAGKERANLALRDVDVSLSGGGIRSKRRRRHNCGLKGERRPEQNSIVLKKIRVDPLNADASTKFNRRRIQPAASFDDRSVGDDHLSSKVRLRYRMYADVTTPHATTFSNTNAAFGIENEAAQSRSLVNLSARSGRMFTFTIHLEGS